MDEVSHFALSFTAMVDTQTGTNTEKKQNTDIKQEHI